MSTVVTPEALRQQLAETVQVIRGRASLKPNIGVVVGSGLAGIAQALEVEATISFADLPHMPPATAPGHEGTMVLGTLAGQRLAVLNGRFHCYEGYTPQQVVYPIRLLRALEVETLLITSIVGSMNPAMPPGALVVLEDHLNLMGLNPLIGPNDDQMGARFPDMSAPYDAALRRLAQDVAKAQRLPLPEGVYVAVAGPNLETRAEYRMLRQLGADVVGMSMVPEVLAARHGNMRVFAVVVVSDACDPDHLKPATVEELLKVAGEAEPKLTALLTGMIRRLSAG